TCYCPEVGYHSLAGVYAPPCTFCLDRLLTAVVGAGDTIVPARSVFALPYAQKQAFFSDDPNRDATHTQLEKSQAIFGLMSPLVSAAPQSFAPLAASTESAHTESAVGTISAGQV